VSDDLTEVQDGDSDLVKQLRTQLKKESKARKEAEDAAGAASKSLGEKTVTDLLSAKKINPKVAGFMPAELDKSDEAAVTTWLTENADVFGYSLEAEAPPEPQTPATQEEQDGHEAMQIFGQQAGPAPRDKVAALDAIPDNLSLAELHAEIAKVGG